MPPDEYRSEGTPSLSEGPYVRGETFGYFGAFAKVTRCKSGTISRRDRRNGYVHKKQKTGQPLIHRPLLPVEQQSCAVALLFPHR